MTVPLLVVKYCGRDWKSVPREPFEETWEEGCCCKVRSSLTLEREDWRFEAEEVAATVSEAMGDEVPRPKCHFPEQESRAYRRLSSKELIKEKQCVGYRSRRTGKTNPPLVGIACLKYR